MERSALLSDPTVSGSDSSAAPTAVAEHAPEALRPVAGPEGLPESTIPERVPQQPSQQRYSQAEQGQAVEGLVQPR